MKKTNKQLLFERMHSIGGMPIKEGDYFNEKLPDEQKRGTNMYVGRGVTWYGEPAQMIVVRADQVEGMWGNIYDDAKLNEVVNMIRYSEDNVEFECSYGIGGVINLTDIIEEQQAVKRDSFIIDYDGKEEPASFNDEELDDYVGSEYIDDSDIYFNLEDADMTDFMEKYRFQLAQGKMNEQAIIDRYNQELGELASVEENKEDLALYIDIEKRVKDAIQNQEGDIGKFMVQLRDGHHRVMGAIKAGEQYVCMNLAKDDVGKFSQYINRVTQKAEV